MANVPIVQRRVCISGRVQGVFFRQSTRELARRLGLRGWVRNRRDGRVEATFSGPPEAVDRIVEWCHQGPPGAGVTAVEIFDEQSAELMPGFSIRPTQ